MGDDLGCMRLAQALLEQGVYVNCAVPPAVPRGGALLRAMVTAIHERSHIDEALEVFAGLRPQLADG